MMNPATQYSQDSSLALFGLLSSPFSFSSFSFSSFSLSPSLSSLATITRRPACCSRKVWFVYFPVQSHNKIFPKIVGFEQTSCLQQTADKPCKDTFFIRTSFPCKAQPDRLHHILVADLMLQAEDGTRKRQDQL